MTYDHRRALKIEAAIRDYFKAEGYEVSGGTVTIDIEMSDRLGLHYSGYEEIDIVELSQYIDKEL